MSDYNNRWVELQDRLRSPEERDLTAVGENGTEQAQILSRYSVASDTLESYCEWRGQALTMIASAIDSLSGSPDSRQSSWASLLASAASESQSKVMDAVKDDRAPALREFAATVAQEESQFFLQLGKIPLPSFQGQLIIYTESFQQAATKLKEEWNSLGDGVRSVGEKAASVYSQIRGIVYSTVEKLIEQDRGITQKLNNFKADPSKPPNSELAALAQALQASVQVAMFVLNEYTRPMSDYVQQLTDIASQEDLFRFTEIRSAVAEFLQNTNLDLATREYNEAKARALDLATDCPTSGSRQDAIEFVQATLARVDPLLSGFNQLYTQFIDQNRGIFVGYVDLSRLDELLKLSAAQTACDELERSNIETTLKEFLDHTFNWNVSVDGLFDEDKAVLQDLIRKQLEPLSHGIVEINNDRYIDVARGLIKERLLPQRKRLEDSRGAGT
jgi:hypothetical protein